LADFQREIRKVESGGAGRLRVFFRISALTRRRAEGLRHIPVSIQPLSFAHQAAVRE